MPCSSRSEFIAVIYRPSRGSKTEFLNFHEEILEFLSQFDVPLIIKGDANIDTSLVNMYASKFNNT